MENNKRTVTCGYLRKADDGRSVTLNGWIHRKRDHGSVSFINLRDRDGVTQVVADAELSAITAELRNEYCIAVEGIVRVRPENMVNPEMPTGEIEVYAEKIIILNRSEVLPFQIDEETRANEDLRLKYRYLDLRSGGMARRIRLRSEIAFAVREWLTTRGFLEIETPTFIKSTPEGARDYLVPSRLHMGRFYALPQSPQLYKQLLMVAGFDKYFQIARCYRDEDARGDRQPEFTQIDIEMSFISREDVLTMTEGLVGYIFRKALNVQLPKRFTRLTWEEAQERFGTDKPDLRFGMELRDFAPFVEKSDFSAFKDAIEEGYRAQSEARAKGVHIAGAGVKALVVPDGGATFSRKRLEELEAYAKIYKAKGLVWFKIGMEHSIEGGASKFFASQSAEITSVLNAKAGDLVLLIGDAKRTVANTALGAIRSKLGKDLGLYDKDKFEFVWIVDFPLFKFNEEENHWEAAHHLFSSPKEEFLGTMEKDPGAVLGELYDLVLNGYELASGSIRIHDPALQKRVFAVVGIGTEEAEQKFGFLTNAFKYGAPPHGGIAHGMDRLVMLMAGESSIKEVIAFPKNTLAVNPMDDCPSEVEQKQLDELYLKIKKNTHTLL